MTRTMTSKAPGSGTSISSSWKASTGSPSRSSRITQAAMVAGSSPGSVLTPVTSVRSAWAMRSSSSSAVGRGRRGWYRRAGGGRLRAQQLVLARRPLAADEERGRLEHLRARKRTLRARADRVAALLDVGLDRCRVLRVDRPDPLARLLALEDHGVRGGVLVRDDEDDRARSDAARRDVDLPRGDHAGDLERRGRAHRPAVVVRLAAACERRYEREPRDERRATGHSALTRAPHPRAHPIRTTRTYGRRAGGRARAGCAPGRSRRATARARGPRRPRGSSGRERSARG